MDQTTFDNLIEGYVIKKIDEDNSAVVKYVLKNRAIRCRSISINNEIDRLNDKINTSKFAPKNKRAVITPEGIFTCVREASESTGYSQAYIYHRCRNNLGGYSYEEEKENDNKI